MSVVENCARCDAYCCRHIALYIDNPHSKNDFDIIRWYLMHEHIWISIDHEGDWLLEMRTSCRNITSNFKCKIYKDRPRICRDYPGKDELCERQTEELSYKHIFKNDKELEKYLVEKRLNPERKGQT